jgi:hypothetical protein
MRGKSGLSAGLTAIIGVAVLLASGGGYLLHAPPGQPFYRALIVIGIVLCGSAVQPFDQISQSLSGTRSRWLIGLVCMVLSIAMVALAGFALGFGSKGIGVGVLLAVIVAVVLYGASRLSARS